MSNANEYVIGVVEEVSSRTTTYGVMWDLYVNGRKYGCGKVKPKTEKGECVKFRVTRNGSWENVAPGSLEKHEGEAPTPNTELVKELSKPPTSNQTYADKDQDRQRSIILQSARKDAIEVAKLLVQADCMGFKSTSKWGEKHDLVLAKINDLTRTFYHNTLGYAEFVGNALPKVTKEETGE